MRALAACALSLSCGCSAEPATQIVVVIDSDLSIPDELDEIRVRVLGEEGELATDRVIRLGSGEGQFVLPADFGVAPRDDDAGRLVTIELTPMLQGTALFVTRAISGFREGHRLRLDMMLAARCHGAAACPEQETCGPQGCVPALIETASLPEFEP